MRNPVQPTRKRVSRARNSPREAIGKSAAIISRSLFNEELFWRPEHSVDNHANSLQRLFARRGEGKTTQAATERTRCRFHLVNWPGKYPATGEDSRAAPLNSTFENGNGEATNVNCRRELSQ